MKYLTLYFINQITVLVVLFCDYFRQLLSNLLSGAAPTAIQAQPMTIKQSNKTNTAASNQN